MVVALPAPVQTISYGEASCQSQSRALWRRIVAASRIMHRKRSAAATPHARSIGTSPFFPRLFALALLPHNPLGCCSLSGRSSSNLALTPNLTLRLHLSRCCHSGTLATLLSPWGRSALIATLIPRSKVIPHRPSLAGNFDRDSRGRDDKRQESEMEKPERERVLKKKIEIDDVRFGGGAGGATPGVSKVNPASNWLI